MLAIGDKLIVTTNTPFLNIGDVVRVTNVNNEEFGVFSFVSEENPNKTGMMSISMCEKYFEKVIEEAEEIEGGAPSIMSEQIEEIIANSEIEVNTVFDKCTIVACKLPNGFVLVESSACVSPENYDKEMGINICLNRIADKIWELEGYRLQNELYEEVELCSSCEGCPYECCDDNEEIDECLDTDLDCDECDDYECPFNTNSNN